MATDNKNWAEDLANDMTFEVMEPIDNTYTLEQKLDFILNHLKSVPNNACEYDNTGHSFSELSMIRKLNNNEYKYLIEKLQEDGYIHWNKNANPSIIKLLYKGYFFEGYVKQKQKDSTQKHLQSAISWAIAIGTALSGLYVLGKGFIWIYQHFCY